MGVIFVQQFASRNIAVFRLVSLINLRKCCNPHTTSSMMSSRCLQTRRNHAYNHYQQLATSSNTRFSDLTRKHICFSDLIHANHKLHQSRVNKPPCRSTHGDLLSRCSLSLQRCTRRSILQKTFHPQPASSDISAPKYFQMNRPFHTSPQANVLLPPQMWLLLKPAQKLFAIIIGRSVRKWWQALPPNKRDLFKESMKRNKWKLIASLSGLGIVFILFYFTHLEENPVTGRSRLIVFRKEHYDFLTKLEYEGLIEEFNDQMLPEIDPRHLVVQKIVDHLIKCNRDMAALSEIKWVVHVVEKSDINAFVLPNGQVFVFTGLLEAVADTHQLSFILGHEIAHVLLEHTAEMASVAHFLDFLFLISLMMIWAICPLDSLAVVGQWIQSKLKEFMFDRPYGRTLEAEADNVGLQLAAKACIDVRASSVFWQQMELSATLEGQMQIPEWLSTHPSHENRAEHLNRLIPEALKLRESCNCPALSGPDPRLIFQLSMHHLIDKSKGKNNMVLESPKTLEVGLPIHVEEKYPVLTAVKAVKN